MSTCSVSRCAFNRICVPGAGPMPANIMVIGEAPGAEELRTGVPFVGRAGELLNVLLAEAGINRADIRVTNTCGCVDLSREDKRPLPAELMACRPRLEQEIDMTDPRIIVLLGNTAMDIFFPGKRIGAMRGVARSTHGRVVMPTYHPAHVLRGNHAVRGVILEDLKQARRLLDSIS